jgi:hypothetical protein
MIAQWIQCVRGARRPRAGCRFDTLSTDLNLIHQTQPFGLRGVQVSTAQAIEAATRLFTHNDWTGLGRRRVVELLGDPPKAANASRNTLVYRFDNGFSGWQYTVRFLAERVCAVAAQPIA